MGSAVSTACPAGPCMGTRTSAKASLGVWPDRPAERVTHRTHRLGRRPARQSDEVDDVAAPPLRRRSPRAMLRTPRISGAASRAPKWSRRPRARPPPPQAPAAHGAYRANLGRKPLAKQRAAAVRFAGDVVCHEAASLRLIGVVHSHMAGNGFRVSGQPTSGMPGRLMKARSSYTRLKGSLLMLRISGAVAELHDVAVIPSAPMA
jgi:hypothetical protein